MRKEITGDIEITPAMVKKFFNRIKDSLPMLPAEYEVAQIMKYPLVSKSEKQVVIEKLNDLKKQILAGADFAALAKIHSEDFSSATQGGGLGFRGRGELVPEFEATAFKLAPNEISEPIESQFGFHLIQLLERRGNRFNARHILIRPSSGDLNFKETKKLLDSIRTLVLTDKMPFEKAAKEFSDDRATKTNGGFFTGQSSKGNRVQAEELDYGAFRVIDTMKVGNISEPFVFRNDEGKEAVRILFYKKKVAAHQADLVADYEKLQQIALNEQKNKHIEKWFLKAINDLYIDIDPEYKDCQLLELAVE
jgi:peptidyl-prolyl cis-trans isomerase SurA